MDKQKSLGDKLREMREEQGLGQDYIYTRLNMTQPAYSCIENNKVRFSPKLVKEISSIKGFEDFDRGHAPNRKSTLASRWPLSRNLLYIIVFIGGALLIDPLFQIGLEFYRGFADIAEVDKDYAGIAAVVFLLIYIPLIWWIIFKKKW